LEAVKNDETTANAPASYNFSVDALMEAQEAFTFALKPNEACYFNIKSPASDNSMFTMNGQQGKVELMLIDGDWNPATTKLTSKLAHYLPYSPGAQIPVEAEKSYQVLLINPSGSHSSI